MADFGGLPAQSNQSNLLGNGLLGGGEQLDPETLRTLMALRALLAQGGQGGQTFINPITQADALSQIQGRQNAQNPIMGPSSNGVRFLFPGGRVAPPQASQNDYLKQAARSALITNLLSSTTQNLPDIIRALRGPRGQ